MLRARKLTRSGIIVLLGLGLTGCGRGGPAEPDIARRIPVDQPNVTSLLVSEGSFWIAGEGGVTRLDSAGVESRRVPLPASTEAVELLGESEGVIYLRMSDALGEIAAASGSIRTGRVDEDADAFILDPRGRFIYQSADDGAVTAFDRLTLLPVWGWGAVGGASEGISLSPEADRFYQAVNAGEGSRMLVRDLQTGRVLREIELDREVRRMRTSRSGSIYVLLQDGDDGLIARYDWEEGTPVEQWRSRLPGITPSSDSRLLPAPSGQLLAVLTPGNEEGLHIIDAETGETTGQLTGPASDLAFGSGGEIFLLVRGEILELEPVGQ